MFVYQGNSSYTYVFMSEMGVSLFLQYDLDVLDWTGWIEFGREDAPNLLLDRFALREFIEKIPEADRPIRFKYTKQWGQYPYEFVSWSRWGGLADSATSSKDLYSSMTETEKEIFSKLPPDGFVKIDGFTYHKET